jgi:HEAT repeat protein
MLRSSRLLASLIRSLVLGTAATTATLAIASTVVGCKDESQPEYWTEKLDDPAWRARAVKRLEQFFEDTMTNNRSDIKAAPVQELINKTVDPLVKAYMDKYGEMDTKTRVSLIKLLAAYRDKRTEPALKKAFEEFAKSPKTTQDEQDIKWAARAQEDLKLATLADPLLGAFSKLRASSMLGGVSYRDLTEAMVAAPSKSWVGPLTTKLEPEIPKLDNKDKDSFDQVRDQVYWQTTAARVLGLLGDPSAVEPLMKVMLDPSKANVATTAANALVKLGKPSMDAAVKLLKGQDEKLASFYTKRFKELTNQEPKGKPYVATAAIILGSIGRPESIPVMIEALNEEKDDGTKAVIARELTKIPATEASKTAFKETFESIAPDAEIQNSGRALDALTEAAGQFFDPGMVDWLLDRAEKAKGSEDDRKGLQLGLALTALKLAKPSQLSQVKAAVNRYGSDLEKKLAVSVEKLLGSCGDKASCYVQAIQKGENQDRTNQFVGIKAGYMIAILGNEQTRDELIAGLGSVDNAALRYVSALAIDKLTPKGSKDAVAKLQAVIDKNAKSPDKDKQQGDEPLKLIVYRLEARS